MNFIKTFSSKEIASVTRKRSSETKWGEKVRFIENSSLIEEELQKSTAKFVLLGLPEDIGVKANYGRGGTHTAWKPALESILNLQSNQFLSGEEMLVLGEVDFSDLMKKAETIDAKHKYGIEHLRKLVEFIDARVIDAVRLIAGAGKIPIIIGGGHNNAYGNIKGTNEGLRLCQKQKCTGINVINCDPHTDFRTREGRHSGNGFSYAFEENLLHKYSVFAAHEQYNTNQVLEQFAKHNEYLHLNTYEDIFVRENKTFSEALNDCIEFVHERPCGVELDLDAITNVPSSAKTSSGISPLQARQYVYQAANKLNACYLHIAEGAPVLAHIKADNKTGKLIAYLVCDFMKGVLDRSKTISSMAVSLTPT